MSHKVYLTSISLFVCMLVIAQPISKSTVKNDTTGFKIQTNYLSNYVYNGRSDSLKAPYFYTSASLNLANGLYANIILNYLLTPGQSGYDYSAFDLGYNYSLNDKVSGEIYGSKYFYGSKANLLNGNMSSDIGFSFNYDLTYLNFHNSFDVFFTDKADFQLAPGLEKEIQINTKNNSLSITPSIYGNLSSLNFYESTINKSFSKLKNLKLQNQTNGSLQRTTSVDQKEFKFLDVEFSLPISYDAAKWNFSFTPTYAIPFNKISTTSLTTSTLNGVSKTVSSNSTPFSENHLDNIFFFDFGITYNF